MPGCAAIGCNNRSEKGYTMKCFPRDPTLRRIWKERVSRADWEPSNNSFLCHVHFEADQWTRSQSGRIRLKKNAVPSIFTITSTRKSPRKRKKFMQSQNLYIVQNPNDNFNDSELLTLRNTLRNQFVGNSGIRDNNRAEIYSIYKRESIREMNSGKEKNLSVTFDENPEEIGKIMIDQDFREIYGSKDKVKTENDQDLDDIERKLRLICDGESQTDETEEKLVENGKIEALINEKECLQKYLIANNSEKFEEEKEKSSDAKKVEAAAINRNKGSRREIMENIEKNLAKDANSSFARYANKKSAFTIKITGIKEDVSEIMDGLDTGKIFKYKYKDETENDVTITSVISVIDYSSDNTTIDEKSQVPKPEIVDSLKTEIADDSPSFVNPNSLSNGDAISFGDESLKNSMIYESCRKKFKSQEEVIQKLTNELMAIKYEFRERDSAGKGKIGISGKEKNAESKNSDFNDFSTRLKQLDAANKGLTNVLIEKNHQIKKLEWQIRKRDNSIKELNWKLDKASKYFERAEKRANTYRKKMVNMQNMIARRKNRQIRAENEEIEGHAINGKKSLADLPEEGTNDAENVNESNETEIQYIIEESPVYRTVQDIFDESNDCDDDLNVIDTREDFFLQFKDSI